MGLEESRQVTRAAMKKDEDCESMESSSINNDSEAEASISSLTSSAELADDATSSSSSNSYNSSSPSRGALYEFTELMAQLPIKPRRGLSKYYNGKSQTFASLANVRSVGDLAKKEMSCYSKRMKSCKSYGSNLNRPHRFGPNAAITKRSPKLRII